MFYASAKLEDTYMYLFQSGHSYTQSEGKNDDELMKKNFNEFI